MSADRKLLELAAKAAGLRIAYWHDDWAERDPEYRYGTAIVEGSDGQRQNWNPLADDGDALRLAVKLGLSITQLAMEVIVDDRASTAAVIEPNDDRMAATRRAIVRAAAEIGHGVG